MKRIIIVCLLVFLPKNLFCQTNFYPNKSLIETLYHDSNYLALKEKVSKEFAHSAPGHWGEFVKGVDEDLVTQQKIIAFTFDACGGKNSDGYDSELIAFLRKAYFISSNFLL